MEQMSSTESGPVTMVANEAYSVHTVSSSRQVPVYTNEAYGVCTHHEEPEYEVVEID